MIYWLINKRSAYRFHASEIIGVDLGFHEKA
jgi:hypothetical protein